MASSPVAKPAKEFPFDNPRQLAGIHHLGHWNEGSLYSINGPAGYMSGLPPTAQELRRLEDEHRLALIKRSTEEKLAEDAAEAAAEQREALARERATFDESDLMELQLLDSCQHNHVYEESFTALNADKDGRTHNQILLSAPAKTLQYPVRFRADSKPFVHKINGPYSKDRRTRSRTVSAPSTSFGYKNITASSRSTPLASRGTASTLWRPLTRQEKMINKWRESYPGKAAWRLSQYASSGKEAFVVVDNLLMAAVAWAVLCFLSMLITLTAVIQQRRDNIDPPAGAFAWLIISVFGLLLAIPGFYYGRLRICPDRPGSRSSSLDSDPLHKSNLRERYQADEHDDDYHYQLREMHSRSRTNTLDSDASAHDIQSHREDTLRALAAGVDVNFQTSGVSCIDYASDAVTSKTGSVRANDASDQRSRPASRFPVRPASSASVVTVFPGATGRRATLTGAQIFALSEAEAMDYYRSRNGCFESGVRVVDESGCGNESTHKPQAWGRANGRVSGAPGARAGGWA